MKNLYAGYQHEASQTKFRVLSSSYFSSLWQKIMQNGVTDPTTGTHFHTFLRTRRARGFAMCDTCELLKAKIMRAKNKTLRDVFVRKLDRHYAAGNADRQELARIARYASQNNSLLIYPCIIQLIVYADCVSWMRSTSASSSTPWIRKSLGSQRRRLRQCPPSRYSKHKSNFAQ